MAERCTKEIGVRKVPGASVTSAEPGRGVAVRVKGRKSSRTYACIPDAGTSQEISMADAAQAFIDQSRRFLLAEYLPKIERCVRTLTDEEVWWRPNEASNSIGNLLLHLSGNVGQWVVSGVGGSPDPRERQQEFDARAPMAASLLLDRLRETLEAADRVLAGLDGDRLLEPCHIQGLDVTVLEAVYHVVEHFSTHVGQIIYVTKLRTGRDLSFYEMAEDGSVRRGWLGGPAEPG